MWKSHIPTKVGFENYMNQQSWIKTLTYTFNHSDRIFLLIIWECQRAYRVGLEKKVGFENYIYQPKLDLKVTWTNNVGFENHMYQEKLDLKITWTNKSWDFYI